MRGNLDAVANGEVMQRGDEDSLEAQASENNSESGESDGAVVPFETVPTPQSSDAVEEVPVNDLDDLDSVEWIDEIDFGGNQGPGEHRILSEQTHRWRGVDWNTLVIIKSAEKSVGLFLGFENFPELPVDWHCNLRFAYSFVGDDGKVFIQCPDVSHHFVSNTHESRIDRGNFQSADIHKLASLGKIHCKNFPKVRVKVSIEEQFTPAKVPINYDSKTTTGMVGLENLGATCYLNALLQMLFHVNSFRKAVYMLPHENEIFKSSTTLALQSVFSNLQTSRKEVTTKDLTVAFGWTSAEAFMQQDVQEMMRVLMDKLETKMTGTVVDGFIKKMFAGTVRSFIQCLNVDYVSQREEVFYDIQLDVKGCKDIYASFDKYVEPEVLDGDNQYQAEGHGKQDAKKGEIFTKFPPVLTIHLKRFEFDFNTMGFNKIHDHYVFPEKLNLDKYLAENSPPESRAVPNDYVLHSVLVHAGDVGGGHYYAYIRPTSATYDYSKAAGPVENRTGRNTQWYKFNDEVVMQVQAREAIENTYGRRMSDFKSGFSSAYMLVYIRAAEAPQIMQPVSATDIPKGLVDRLETELKERRDAERAELRDRMFTQINYATEDTVRSFTKYSRTNDFLTFSDLTPKKILRGNKRIGLLLQLAEELDVCPAQVRLWLITNCNGIEKSKGPLRVAEDFDVIDLQSPIDPKEETQYYVQVLKEEELPADALLKFEKEFKLIMDDVNRFLDRLRLLILSVPAIAELFSGEDDPVEGCGLGNNNFYLFKNRILPEEIKQQIAELRQFDEHVLGQFFDSYSQVVQEIRSDGVLVFLRAFDPTNSLPLIDHTSRSTPEGEGIDDVVLGTASAAQQASATMAAMLSYGTGGDDALGSLVNRQLYIGGVDSRQSSPGRNVKEPEYMPMKFVGSVMMKKQSTVQEVLKEFKNLLWAKVGDNFPHDWVDSPSQRLHFEYNSIRSALVDLHEESNLTIESLNKNNQSAIFVVDIPKLTMEASASNLLPFHIADPPEWLRYRSQRRMFHFKPISSRERIIVNKLRSDALLGSAAAMDTEDSTPATTTASDEAGLKKRVNSGISEPDSPQSPYDVSEFSQYLPSYDKMTKMFDLLSETLLVDRRHLILYMVPSNFVSESPMESAQECTPITLHDHELAISVMMNKHSTIKSTAYHIFYHISPFPVVSEEGRQSVETHKMYEIFINDARLRKWRQHFIEHQESSVPVNGSNLSASALKLNNSGTVPSGNSQEDAEGSPPITNNADLKRRRLSPQPSDLLENSSHEQGGLSASMLAKVQWPTPSTPKYDVMEPNRVHVSVANHLTIATVCAVLRGLIGLPSNLEELVSTTEYMNARDIEALDSSYQVLNDPAKVAQFSAANSAVTSDAVRVVTGSHSQLSCSMVPSYPLAILVIRNSVVNEIYEPNRVVPGSVISWMDAHELLGRLYSLAVMHVSPLDMVFMSNRHPTIRSMPVSVFNFTLLGSVVQPCDVDQFGGPFVTYVREDDDYDSFFARVRSISGDNEEEWEKVRPAVVRNRIPHFIRRPTIAHVSSRLGSTKLSSSDSLSGMGTNAAATAEGNEDEAKTSGGGAAAAGPSAAEDKTIYEHFLAQFKDWHGKTPAEVRGRVDSDKWIYPTFGIQRSVADAGRKYVTRKAIKIA